MNSPAAGRPEVEATQRAAAVGPAGLRAGGSGNPDVPVSPVPAGPGAVPAGPGAVAAGPGAVAAGPGAVAAGPGAVTLQDVARAADVAISTVSRALSNPDRVSRATREHVTAVARSLGYQAQRPAMRTQLLARLVPTSPTRSTLT